MDTPTGSNKQRKSSWLEWLLAILAAINIFWVVIIFAANQTSGFDQGVFSLWPFPLIYFVEITALGILGILAVSKLQSQKKSVWSGVLWIGAGILLAFVILGAWTIGFFLVPAMILFLVLGIIIDKRTKGDIPLHLVYFVGSGIAQAVLVFITLIG
jgi:hypothetical protein